MQLEVGVPRAREQSWLTKQIRTPLPQTEPVLAPPISLGGDLISQALWLLPNLQTILPGQPVISKGYV